MASGFEARRLYRDCLRALCGIDDATAISVREQARGMMAANAHETDLKVLRVLLIDGRHSLDELAKCLGTVRSAKS